VGSLGEFGFWTIFNVPGGYFRLRKIRRQCCRLIGSGGSRERERERQEQRGHEAKISRY
jgi:hypothetical protein